MINRALHLLIALLMVIGLVASVLPPTDEVQAQGIWEASRLIPRIAVDSQVDRQQYVDEEYGFSVQYPAGWIYRRGNKHAPTLPTDALSFQSKPGTFDLTLISLENDIGLDPMDLTHQVIAGCFGELEEISVRKDFVDGLSVGKAVYAQPIVGGSSVHIISTIVLRGQWAYWLFTQIEVYPSTGEAVSGEDRARSSLYEEMVNSFNILPAGPQQQLLPISSIGVAPLDRMKPSGTNAANALFLWPSTGYLGYIYGQNGHNGIDIWTNTSGNGNSGSKGNPVYPPASGRVTFIYSDPRGAQQGIRIEHGSVGGTDTWTHYWHMADEATGESYIEPGLLWQDVDTNSLLGYQGDRLYFTGTDQVVHLHLTVADGDKDANDIDPSSYFNTKLNWDDPDHVGWHHYVEHPAGCTDTQTPDGDYYDGIPQAGGWYNNSAYLKAWGQDYGCDLPSGVDQVLFRAYYSGDWHTIRDDGSDCSGGSRCDYDYTWNLSGVPDGEITMGFDLKDKNGNWAYTPQGTFPINKYSDDPPHISFDYANGTLVNHNGQDFERNNPNWSFSGTAIDDQAVDHVDYHSQGSNGNLTYRANGTTNWNYSRNDLYGHNRVYFFAYDTRGQRNPDGDKHYIDLYVDTAAPSTGHNLVGTMGRNGWYVSPVQVSLVAHDNGSGNGSDHWASGVQTLYYQVDSGSWQQHSGSSKTITVSGDGTHTVRYYARDKVGNQEGQHEATFKIDATLPTAPGVATETHGVISGQWQKDVNDPAFTWDPATDVTSGLEYYRVTWNDTLQVVTNTAYGPLTVGTGSYNLSVQAVDRAGNVGPAGASFTFNYDGTPPHAPEIQNNDGVPGGVWQNQVRTADFYWLTPHDEGSGIAGYNVYWGPDPEGTSGVLTPDNTFMDSTPICAADEAAIYYLRARSRDNVDWPSEWVAYALAYDGAPPTATLIANYGQTVVHQTTVHLDILGDDEGSGVDQMRLSNDARAWTGWLDFADETYWQIPAIGRRDHPIYLQLVDHAGNVSAVVSDTVYLDVNSPDPKSDNYWLWDDATPAGAAEANSTSYNLRSSVGQALDSPVLTSLDYSLVGGFQAGALAEPTVTPTYTVYLQLGQVIASGGTGATTLQSPDFQMYGTLGQPAVVVSITSESYVLLTGFWGGAGTDPQPPGPPPPPPPPPPPDCEFYSLSINDGALVTNSPQVTLSLCGPDAEDVMLSNDGGFGGASWQTYTTTVPWTLEVYGQYVQPRFVYSRFRDSTGAIHGTFFDDILYDPNAPDGEAVFDLADLLPPTGTQTLEVQPLRVVNEESVELFVSATDDSSGLAEMQVSLEPGFTGAEWQPFSAIVPVAFTTEGTNTVYVRFRDRAGNVSDETSDSLIVDTTPPVGAASVPEVVGPSAILVTVVLSATDDTTGVSEVRVSARESFTDTLWQPYAPQVTVPVSFTGEVRPALYVQFRDPAGNESAVYSTTYAVDATPPIGMARVEPGTGTLRTVTLGALDYGSGVAEIHLSPDYFFLENVATIPYTTNISWDFGQSPVVYVRFVDSVGNVSDRISAVLYEQHEEEHQVYLPLVVRNQ